jgi:hypothetical protein
LTGPPSEGGPIFDPEVKAMLRVAAVLWIVIGTSLAGSALIVILTVPQLADQAMMLIPIVCGVAAVLAMPVSWVIAKRIQARLQPPALG